MLDFPARKIASKKRPIRDVQLKQRTENVSGKFKPTTGKKYEKVLRALSSVLGFSADLPDLADDVLVSKADFVKLEKPFYLRDLPSKDDRASSASHVVQELCETSTLAVPSNVHVVQKVFSGFLVTVAFVNKIGALLTNLKNSTCRTRQSKSCQWKRYKIIWISLHIVFLSSNTTKTPLRSCRVSSISFLGSEEVGETNSPLKFGHRSSLTIWLLINPRRRVDFKMFWRLRSRWQTQLESCIALGAKRNRSDSFRKSTNCTSFTQDGILSTHIRL